MASPSPVEARLGPSPENPATAAVSSVKSEIPAESSTPATSRLTEPSPPATDVVVVVPSYSRWFSWDRIHECERRFLPEFFDAKSPSKNPRVYKYYRDSIIRKSRENPLRKIMFTEARKSLVGDVGSIRRVFDFLEGWGLINYTGTTLKPHVKWEERDSKSGGLFSSNSDSAGSPFQSSLSKRESSKKLCSGCKSVCSIACFACDKFDLTLCARCYVRGNYQVGVSSSDFRRVEISEETKTEWTDKDTLRLLEALMHYGDDWKRVAEHVGGRSEKECVARFVKLPFGEEFIGHPDVAEADKHFEMKDQSGAESGSENIVASLPTKKRCLTPLADASNPIMAQAAFLSAMVGSEVAEAAAQAAVAALSEEYPNNFQTGAKQSVLSLSDESKQQDATGVILEAQALLDKEEQDIKRSISGIVEVQMKEIQDKIVHFEEVELQMEKEWKQLQLMKDLLFVDQLAFLREKSTSSKIIEGLDKEHVKSTDAVTSGNIYPGLRT
uniref:SWI/SNF complex subunit SWI3B n=1 Tax=Nelumbo nucifera TaxID=4432 RepID=A0A822ZNV0_NELNU|nr:TPA_asm: hypothetical protein HUJ06_016420 [Nelumbo nucifera]